MSTTNSKYEPVQVAHSWNANTSLTNYVLFKLQRHSDHHVNAGKRYQVLRSEPLAPQMPTGYAGMIVLALIPPLWFYVMDPRLEQFEKANWAKMDHISPCIYPIHPRKIWSKSQGSDWSRIWSMSFVQFRGKIKFDFEMLLLLHLSSQQVCQLLYSRHNFLSQFGFFEDANH